ncbi:unnamed protein product [Owenia fusiformis]|uniref:Centriolar satellite-associated tubulin polyglutamylase complex regulator 1 n=1 Tax=Owenia fusiformis TaxID=6347 RepID=A0A8J1XVL5_OWEFU|nr:unnamed protein product [Owenia fusiformis]
MDEERFAISAEKYLERHQLLAYLEDAVAQLLDHKDENPKVNTNKFFSEYFTSVKEGNHTLFREYSYIAATAHNRACFVRTFWKCFRHIGKKGDLLNIREYHSLVSLLCGDFPVDILHKTATIILLDDAMECLISFSDFLYTFQLQFYYEEFIEKCREIFKSIEQSQNSPRGAVVIPSSNQSSPPLQNGAAGNDGKDNKSKENGVQHADGIDAMQFFRALVPLCASFEKSCPSVDILRDLLWNEERVTFYGFLMTLAKSESLNENIGKLPGSSDLLREPDLQQSPRLTAAS